MAKVLGILVLLVLLILGAKIALAGFAFLATAASFMAKATGVAIFDRRKEKPFHLVDSKPVTLV